MSRSLPAHLGMGGKTGWWGNVADSMSNEGTPAMRSVVRLGMNRRWSVLHLVLLLAACGGGGGPTATPKPGASTPNAGAALATAFPGMTRNIDKVDDVFLQMLIVY